MANVVCVELNPDSAAKLNEKNYAVRCGDFLELPWHPNYDRVVMNPPFSKDQDIKHVAHAFRFLKPGGILTAIMSGNTDRPKFKALLEGLGSYQIIAVPAGAFKQSGTSIATIILRVEKGTNQPKKEDYR